MDVALGSLICWFLTLHRRTFEREPRGPIEPRRILFIKFIEQGATVLAHEAIVRAIRRVGRQNVYFCVFVENRPILDILDLIPPENVIVLRSDRLSRFLADAWRALAAIRRARIDATIDMELLSRASAIFGYLTRARVRVGLHRFTEEAPYRGDLMTHRVLYNPFLHTARAYRMLVDALDADPTDVPLLKLAPGDVVEGVGEFHPSDEERAKVRAILHDAAGRVPERPIVILNPNAGDLLPLRKWPMDRFAELGRRVLAERPAATVIVTGAASERAAAEELERAIGSPNVVCLAGRTTLREVLVLYGLCDVLVTNDSGPGHFSSLTDIDSIVLFGPGSPRQYGPIGPRSSIVYADLACSPCVNVYNHRFSPCRDNRCMQAISVDEVVTRVLAALDARSAGRAEPEGAAAR